MKRFVLLALAAAVAAGCSVKRETTVIAPEPPRAVAKDCGCGGDPTPPRAGCACPAGKCPCCPE